MDVEIKPIMWGLMWKLSTKKFGYNINLSFHFSYEKARDAYDRLY